MALLLDEFQQLQHGARKDEEGKGIIRDAAYEELLRRLREDDYSQHMCFLTRANWDLVRVLRRYMTSGYSNKLSGELLEASQARRLAVYELLVGLLVRNVDEDTHVFALIVLSLFLLRNRASVEIWAVLNMLRVSYSYTTTREIATDLGFRAMSAASIPADSSAIVMVGVYDNCMYSSGTSNEHIDEEHRNDNYQTISIMTAALPGALEE